MERIPGISRRKTDWLVRVCYVDRKPKYQKAFPDAIYGGCESARQAAIRYREECVATGDRPRPRARWERNGFGNGIEQEEMLQILDVAAHHVLSVARYKAICSDLEISEIAQSAALALVSKDPAEIDNRRRYISIMVGLAARSLFMNKIYRGKKILTRLDAVERSAVFS